MNWVNSPATPPAIAPNRIFHCAVVIFYKPASTANLGVGTTSSTSSPIRSTATGTRSEINVRHGSLILWADTPTIGPAGESHFEPACRPLSDAPSAFSCPAVLEAAAHEKKTNQTKNRAAENKIGPPGSRSIEGRRDRKPPIAGVAAWLPACH